jgi:hypothetical protein
MPTAEELLNQVAETTETGDEPISYITVDLDSRKIIIPPTITNIGVTSDDDVNRLWFKMPRFYKGVDLSEFEVRINYTNAADDGDMYRPNDVNVEDSYITFSWLVGRFACEVVGEVKFSLCLIDSKDGIIDREFNTTKARLMNLEGLETVQGIVESEPDILAIASKNGADIALADFERALDSMIALCDDLSNGGHE